MFSLNEFEFTVQVKHKINSIQNSWLYFNMFLFYDWPFPHVYFAKNVAYFPLILGSVFSDSLVFYGDYYKAERFAILTGLNGRVLGDRLIHYCTTIPR